jgi:hypothetical protein
MREMQDCVMQEVRLSQTTKSAFKNHMMVVGEVLSSLAMRKSRIPLTEVSGISTVVHGLVIAGGSVLNNAVGVRYFQPGVLASLRTPG